MSKEEFLSALNRCHTSLPWLTFDLFLNIIDQLEPGAELMQVIVGSTKFCEYVLRQGIYKGDLLYLDTKGNPKFKIVLIREIAAESVYLKEVDLVFKLLPKFERILQEAGDLTKFGPNFYFYRSFPVKLLVYEHLYCTGFRHVIRSPDLMQLELALVKIAKWHAVSYKLALEEPSIFEKFQHPLLDFEIKCLNGFVITLGKFPNLKKFKPYFEALSEKNYLQEVQDLALQYRDNRQPDVYYGLCQGDFHFRNVMFKEKEVRFTEFQGAYMGPIVHDIMFALYTSLTNFNHAYVQDELICYYFHIFLITLRDIKFIGETPKLAEFRKQFIKNKKFEFYIIYKYMPFWLGLFAENPIDFTRALCDLEYRSQVFESKKFIEHLEIILPHFLHLGYFDD